MEILHAFLARKQLAIWRKNRRDPNQILGSDTGVTQRQFERSQPLAVFPHSLGKENPLRNHVFAQFAFPPKRKWTVGNAQSNTMLCKGNVNLQARRKKTRGALARPRFMPGYFGGRARANSFFLRSGRRGRDDAAPTSQHLPY